MPPQLRQLLDHYLTGLQREVPGLLAGIYLHGSIAYGAFFEGSSDIDCLALLARPCGADDLDRLREIHRAVRARWPRVKLEASYVQWTDRGRLAPDAPPHPYHHDGVFHDSGIFDFNSPRWSAIVWWMVRQRGIALLGPAPEALGFEVARSALLADSRRLVETFWIDWTRSRAQLSGLRHTSHVDWVVFGILRTWYTLREGDVTTKQAAVAYGLAHLPRRWHRLMRETLRLREQPRELGVLPRLRRAVQAGLFMRFMLGECRRTYPVATVPSPPAA